MNFVDYFFLVVAFYTLYRLLRFFRFSGLPRIKHTDVSIIVPVRNEANRVKVLLNSLKGLEKTPMEVNFVDDDSEDGTADLIKSSGFEVIKTKPPPDWLGKSFACFEGAKRARGEVLIFIDADVILSPQFLEYLGGKIDDSTVITIQPFHEVRKIYEHLSLIFNLVSLIGLGVGMSKNPLKIRRGLFGPCIIIPKSLYESIGGHFSVRSKIVEDMELGILISKSGYEILSLPHRRLIKYRMYPEGFRFLLFGWIKNFSRGAVRSSLFGVIQVLSIIAAYFGLLKGIINPVTPEIRVVFIICFAMYLYLFYSLARELGSYTLLDVILLPVHLFFFTLVFTVSIFTSVFGIRVPWRGRSV
ncbi:MAG: glycosyltransferase [candidate division WOR-3 bacterium]